MSGWTWCDNGSRRQLRSPYQDRRIARDNGEDFERTSPGDVPTAGGREEGREGGREGAGGSVHIR